MNGERELKIMGPEGDTKLMWNPSDTSSVAEARQAFEAARGRGMVAFSVSESGDKDEVIRTFDPTAERIIIAPALRGGAI